MAKVQQKGLKRIFKAGIYSMQGFKAGWQNEAAVRQEMVLAVLLTIGAFFLADSGVKFLLLVIMPWLTVTVELANSAIEAVVDRIGMERHELSGRAKDLGSACVFVMLILTALTWLVIVLEHFGVTLFGA
ncbi:MAG: diacylglycerol kinase [Succinivibrio sp.]|nr:diacylglycerol kinase [Succinivibrio sp.]